MKVELEIGSNLRSTIKDIVDECAHQTNEIGIMISPGNEVAQALGINFVKLIGKSPELEKIVVELKNKNDVSKFVEKIHRHPILEQQLTLDDHIIIDREIYDLLVEKWKQIENILKSKSARDLGLP